MIASAAGGSGGLALHLEKVLHAPPEHVFAACIESQKLAAWWGPAGFTTPSLDLDVRQGGRFRITMQPPEGEAFHLRGAFLQVDPPRLLVYTFEWEEPDPDDRETVVMLSFLDHREGTMLVVDQQPFASEGRLALHHTGWAESLERLEQALKPKPVTSWRSG